MGYFSPNCFLLQKKISNHNSMPFKKWVKCKKGTKKNHEIATEPINFFYKQILNTCLIRFFTKCRIGKSHMKTGFSQLWFLKKKIWSKYTLGIVVSWYNLRNCNIWLFLWHLSPQSGPFYQFWSFLLILFSKTTQKKSKHYSGRAFLEVFGKCVGLGLSSSIQRPQKC